MGTVTAAPSRRKTTCFHCGLDCPDDTRTWQDKHFCCSGCKAVYLLLSDNGLSDYYRDPATPGVRPVTEELDTRYALLDNPDIIERLADFTDGRTCRWTVRLPDIHCAACIWLLERLYRIHPGVQMSRVNFVRKELTVVLDTGRLSVRAFAELLTRLGYEPDLQLQRDSRDGERSHRRLLYQRLGVAGFCYANIMLFSFPEYLGIGGVGDPRLQRTFAWASAVLSLPVLFFSARSYLASAWRALRVRMLNIDVPIALGMLALFVQSGYDLISGAGPGYFDSLAGLTFFLLIGRLFQDRTYDRLSFDRDYRAYFPLAAQRLANGQTEVVPIGDLVPGDRVLIRNREVIPTDSVLTGGQGCIDYSFASGESEPVTVLPGQRMYAGGRQVGSAIEVRVTKPVSQSQLISLWSDSAGENARRPRSQELADRVARHFTAVVLSIALATAIFWMFVDRGTAAYALSSVLIVACPCALALAGPFVLGTAMRLLGGAGLFLRNTAVAERLAYIHTIVFDKTGTLAYTEERHVDFDGSPLTQQEQAWVTSVARHSTHPVSRSLARFLAGEPVPVDDFVEAVGRGVAATVDGHQLRLGTRAWATGTDVDVSDSSLRAGTWLAIDGSVRGVFRLHDRLRDGLAAEVTRLKRHYELAVMSGDADRERDRLESVFGADTRLDFGRTPHDKQLAIRRMVRERPGVMMLGDGLNDAGALEAADVGVAVAEDLAAFTPASDGILQSGRLAGLGKMLRLTRMSRMVIWICYALSFAYNVVGLGFAVTGRLSPVIAAILMPLSSVTVVALATTLTRLAARRAGVR